MNTLYGLALFATMTASPVLADGTYEKDILHTAAGDLEITFIGHASFYCVFEGKVIYNDPDGSNGDYAKLPKADLILVSHEHSDHFDPKTIALLSTEKTELILTPLCAAKLGRGIVMKNGDEKTVGGVRIEAVPAYNMVHMRSPGVPYHAKGDGNGYILTFGDKRIYVAGDTENIQEMGSLGRIDCAFLPMNLPYTMTPKMAADAARVIRPKILYPYHFGATDTGKLVSLLKDEKGIEVRVRQMQ